MSNIWPFIFGWCFQYSFYSYLLNLNGWTGFYVIYSENPTMRWINPPLGVKIRNLKVDFKIGGTWRRVGQWTRIMNIYDFFIRLSRLVSKRRRINKNHKDGRFLFICRRFETKQLSKIKKKHKYSLSVFIARSDAKCLQS